VVWHRHMDVENGAYAWSGPTEVAHGWMYKHVFGSGLGVIYGVTADGTAHWWQHKNWEVGADIKKVTIDGRTVPISLTPVARWIGPVVISDVNIRHPLMTGAVRDIRPSDIG
jgi:hypothetical protein